ncbi:Ankyrin repeat protein [Rhynchospora pubera]|uniref:Ankyrin repeat protein n=1 Tax=Rhynchospora pubera TaxID=906938 RepID=A0AAV8BT44_9POAL|nr:Ankyrin repeat protein [Rhynchospora pubera]
MASYPGHPAQNMPMSTEDDICNPTRQLSSDESMNKGLRKELFEAAMRRDWKKLLELYKSNKQSQNQKITRANDTVLHVAMSGAPEYRVLKLLEIVDKNNSPEETKSILGSENKGGDTPLHLAASLGLEAVCWKMAEMCPELVINARNKLQETPLFTAVRHGKMKTFFVLEAAIHKQQGLKSYKDCLLRDITHCRRSDGINILHIAIKREHFGLAYEIVYLYPELVNYVNSRGESALHVLAGKASVFRSGTRFGLFDTIIYYGTITEPLKLKFNFNEHKENDLQLKILKDKDEILPSTCKACVDLYSLIRDMMNATINTVVSSLKTGICKNCYADEENQSGAQKGDESKSSEIQERRRQIPPNYDVAFSFFKIFIKLLLIVLGIGLRRLQKIKKMKQTHRDALKIMEELVDRSTLWEYDDASGGMKPSVPQLPPELRSQFPPTITTEENPDSEEKHTSPSKVNDNTDSNIMIALKEGGRDMLKKVLEKFSLETRDIDKKDVIFIGMEEKESTNEPDTPSPVLLAAKMGVTEMVKRILEKFPVALLDQDKDEKNIVLLAVEYRRVHVYRYMLELPTMKEHVFGKVDKDGNSAPRLAAMLSHSRPWSIPGAALQMQWESKWYKYVLDSMDQEIFATFNIQGKTAQEVFADSHDTLVKDGSSWLTNTSQSCSLVAALVATVAFASASTVPGGVDQQSGFPVLVQKPAFQLFAISSLVALCFSVTSLVMFLAILTSRYQVRDFEIGLPMKLILGLTSLFMSIAAMLVSFCAGDFFVVEEKLKFAAYPIYAVMCFPVTFFAIAQFPLYIDLIKATIKKVPERTEKMQAY